MGKMLSWVNQAVQLQEIIMVLAELEVMVGKPEELSMVMAVAAVVLIRMVVMVLLVDWEVKKVVLPVGMGEVLQLTMLFVGVDLDLGAAVLVVFPVAEEEDILAVEAEG